MRCTALETPHFVDAAMQVNDPLVTRPVVKPIDVLGDQQVQAPQSLKLRQRQVRRVWRGGVDDRPAVP